MKIKVQARYFIEEELKEDVVSLKRDAIISIYSNCDKSPIRWNKNVLRLQFDDITDREYNKLPECYILFTKAQAHQILDFAEKLFEHKDDKDAPYQLVVHCDAGISRSGAVGLFLNNYFNSYKEDRYRDLCWFYDKNINIVPNPYVLALLYEAWNERKKYEGKNRICK